MSSCKTKKTASKGSSNFISTGANQMKKKIQSDPIQVSLNVIGRYLLTSKSVDDQEVDNKVFDSLVDILGKQIENAILEDRRSQFYRLDAAAESAKEEAANLKIVTSSFGIPRLGKSEEKDKIRLEGIAEGLQMAADSFGYPEDLKKEIFSEKEMKC
jgi:hypothetical protein